jgi:radical SAM protein with 4Fe4S-binding SPASM domain
MSLETFKKIFKLFPPTLTQIAFGIGDIDANPDLWEIMAHCRSIGVVPNITINGMGLTDETAHALIDLCGAVAVSHYHVDSTCFDAIEKLSKLGLKQVNIHKLLSKETYKDCFRLIDEVKTNPKLAGLKAIVFLLLKPKGDRNKLHSINSDLEYKELIEYARSKGVAIGMDSCSAPMVLRNVPATSIPSIEPCESSLFSIYVNVDGELFPCSFTEGTSGWESGIDLTKVTDFHKEVWFSQKLAIWRDGLINSSKCQSCAVQKHCRSCPVYDVTPCRKVCNENS